MTLHPSYDDLEMLEYPG